MKNRFTLLVSLFLLFSTVFVVAQDVNDPKHENHFKKVNTIETDSYKIEISDAHAQQAFCQMKVNVTNKTQDYIFISPEEFVFTFDHGTYSPKPQGGLTSLLKGGLVIAPHKSKSFVAKVTEGANFHVEKFNLEIKGLYMVSTNGLALEAELFQLPANKNSFETGGFRINLTDASQRTQETVAKFTCKYIGDKVGIFDPSKLVVSTEKGEFANMERKSKQHVMQKDDEIKFTAKFKIEGRILDMQFATMNIDWKDTFKESEKVLQESHQLSFELDPGMTAGKNK